MSDHEKDFEAILGDRLPASLGEFRRGFQSALKESGGQIANQSEKSPFFLLLSALVSRPLLTLRSVLLTRVLPNLFLKTAEKNYLDIIAWSYNLTRKPATKARGRITLTRAEGASGDITIPKNTAIRTPPIGRKNTVYRVLTQADATLAEGQDTSQVEVEARNAGQSYNLGDGYYSILDPPIAGIRQAANAPGWLSRAGSDIEDDTSLRERCRLAWTRRSGWHTDDTYRSILSSFDGVRPEYVFFDKSPARGTPASVDAYIMLETGTPSPAFIQRLNRHINEAGNHGHGDDLRVQAMPALNITINLTAHATGNATNEEKNNIRTTLTRMIQAAFRENNEYPNIERVSPYSRFSFSKLARAAHDELPLLESLDLSDLDDIISARRLPTLASPPRVTVR